MKHIIFYGPGTSPTMLVDDEKAVEIGEKFKNGEAFEVSQDDAIFYIREHSCRAMKVENFKDPRDGQKK